MNTGAAAAAALLGCGNRSCSAASIPSKPPTPW
jgi:hypothetical protein